jgi:predicted CXXCH cytochrome family protein
MEADSRPHTRKRTAAMRFFALALAMAWLGGGPGASATDAANTSVGLSDDDKACIGCHADAALSKKLASGETLSLAVDGAAFAASVHGPIGCAGCHPQLKLPGHPGDVKSIDNARQYPLAKNDACRACHNRVFKTYEGSTHAVRLREGLVAAPGCGDCHRPHQITPASVQDGPKNVCVACHGDTTEPHQQWLPNAASHLRAVACAACHAPEALRRVNLQITVRSQPLTDRDGSLQFERRARTADANHDGLDAREFRALLADLERDGEEIALRGHIELRNGIDAHELPGKAGALRDCVKCHDDEAAPFQNVTVSVMSADGRPVRYDARKEILTSAMTVDALRGFYAIGGTRIRMLDILLALGLLGGISVPALHLGLRRYFGRRANKGETRP